MKVTLQLACAALAAAAAGCGGEGPALSNLRLSADSVTLGRELFALAHASDPDGDLDEGTLRARLVALDGDLALEGEAPVLGFAPGQTEGEVVMGLLLSGAAPLGRYRLELEVRDGAGSTSDVVQANLQYVSGGFGGPAP
jgi:hypothetical protein